MIRSKCLNKFCIFTDNPLYEECLGIKSVLHPLVNLAISQFVSGVWILFGLTVHHKRKTSISKLPFDVVFQNAPGTVTSCKPWYNFGILSYLRAFIIIIIIIFRHPLFSMLPNPQAFSKGKRRFIILFFCRPLITLTVPIQEPSWQWPSHCTFTMAPDASWSLSRGRVILHVNVKHAEAISLHPLVLTQKCQPALDSALCVRVIALLSLCLPWREMLRIQLLSLQFSNYLELK